MSFFEIGAKTNFSFLEGASKPEEMVVQAAVLITAIAIFVLNVVVDILYSILDPRIRDARAIR